MKAIVSGAGVAGFLHVLAYRAHGVAVAGIYDADIARARELAEVCGARVAPSLSELSKVEAELASVCSPPSVHVEQAFVLSRGGRTVLIEKPVAVSLEELVRLRSLPRCVPVVQWRAGRALCSIRRAIAEGELGESPVVSCDLAWARDDVYLAGRRDSWGCGAVLSIGIHAIDAMQWSLGRATVDAVGLPRRRLGAWAETALWDSSGSTAERLHHSESHSTAGRTRLVSSFAAAR